MTDLTIIELTIVKIFSDTAIEKINDETLSIGLKIKDKNILE